MNKVLILSDSHGLTKELDIIKKRHQLENNIHCGDSELVATAPELSDFITVKGNCDWNSDFPEEMIIEIGGLRFFVTHGHLFGVKSSIMNLQYRALEVGADVVCFGHSHIAYTEKITDQLFINPGSIRLPKKFNEPSYVLLEWADLSDVTLTFYNVNGNEITHFPYDKRYKINK